MKNKILIGYLIFGLLLPLTQSLKTLISSNFDFSLFVVYLPLILQLIGILSVYIFEKYFEPTKYYTIIYFLPLILSLVLISYGCNIFSWSLTFYNFYGLKLIKNENI